VRVALVGALGLLLFATGASARSDALHLVRIAHFNAPVYATVAPGEPGNLYVVEQGGYIRVLTGGTIRSTPFLDVHSLIVSGGEQGLLSVAFDPAYQKSHRFFVDYTDRSGDTHVVEYRSNGTRAIPSSAKQRLFVKDFAPNHNGGQLERRRRRSGGPRRERSEPRAAVRQDHAAEHQREEAALDARRLRAAEPMAIQLRQEDG
jgi:hypothetical protein